MGDMADYYIDQHLDAFPDDYFFARRNKSNTISNKSTTKLWKTKEGKLLDIDALEESHMINCVKMCFRNGKPPPARMIERLKDAGVNFDTLVIKEA